ncbi:MAG: dephospho-CoA kinase [Pygmaiobacter sp.]
MKVVGITGSSGSGKSTVAAYYASLGYPVIDGDAISRELAVPQSAYVAALCREFGEDLCDENGVLLRRQLAARAFSTDAGQKRLSAVTTPLIFAEIERRIKAYDEQGTPLVFLDGALIVGTPFAALCDRVLAVLAAPQMQLQRIMDRDGISRDAALERLSRQPDNNTMQAGVNDCLWNLSDREELLCKANELLQKLKAKL